MEWERERKGVWKGDVNKDTFSPLFLGENKHFASQKQGFFPQLTSYVHVYYFQLKISRKI